MDVLRQWKENFKQLLNTPNKSSWKEAATEDLDEGTSIAIAEVWGSQSQMARCQQMLGWFLPWPFVWKYVIPVLLLQAIQSLYKCSSNISWIIFVSDGKMEYVRWGGVFTGLLWWRELSCKLKVCQPVAEQVSPSTDERVQKMAGVSHNGHQFVQSSVLSRSGCPKFVKVCKTALVNENAELSSFWTTSVH